jgi:hypothetical protein
MLVRTGSAQMDAERAFTQMRRARRRAALVRRLRRHPGACGRLAVYDPERLRGAGARIGRGVREIPIDAITGTLEPSRAELFDDAFRPGPKARGRWQRVWLAEDRGAVLPPVSVVPTGDGYALRDGHHRVSVARARGALTVDATVDPPTAR